MNLTGFLPRHCDDTLWSKALFDAGFEVPAISHYAMRTTSPGLVFGFTAFTPEILRSHFDRVSAVLRGLEEAR
jgi:hypothetical protein